MAGRGYTTDMQTQLSALLLASQPNATATNGGGVSGNPLRWSGTEGDSPPGWPNLFSTVCAPQAWGPGCPSNATGAFFSPPSTDYTLQAGDVWFWEPNTPLRPLSELQSTYHRTVGANAVMELDFAIDRTGNVDPAHAALYKAFGDWRRACYASPPLATGVLAAGQSSFLLQLPPGCPSLMDRVVLEEDQAPFGQCVYGYTVEVSTAGGGWAPFSSALTIGNKRIDIADVALNATAVRVNVTGSTCGGGAGGGVQHAGVVVSVISPAACGVLPRTRVRFTAANGQCLSTNSSSSFPCGGDSCPLFLGNCSDETAEWDDQGGQLSSWANGVASTVVNVDCNSCAPRSVAKLHTGTGSPASLTFSGGQLNYACPGAPHGPLCLNGGEGVPTPPCGREPHLPDQVQVDSCGAPGTTGWVRTQQSG